MLGNDKENRRDYTLKEYTVDLQRKGMLGNDQENMREEKGCL